VEPEVTNAADREQLAAADERISLQRKQERDDLNAVLRSPEGRRVLYRVLEDCHLLENIFSADALLMAFRAGEQNVGNKWCARIEQTRPGALFELMRLAAADRDALDRARRASRVKPKEE
jgi:hypothetical protein